VKPKSYTPNLPKITTLTGTPEFSPKIIVNYPLSIEFIGKKYALLNAGLIFEVWKTQKAGRATQQVDAIIRIAALNEGEKQRARAGVILECLSGPGRKHKPENGV